jgi:hypothetical protein
MGIFEGSDRAEIEPQIPTECYSSANRRSLIFDDNPGNTALAIGLQPRLSSSLQSLLFSGFERGFGRELVHPP